MEAEDARASLHRTNRLLTQATDKIDFAMALSRENLVDIEMQEQNVWENWKQSWDVMEDGNAWMGLNNRRKYLRVNRVHEEEYLAAEG
jgi:hypoxanthine phosphoribosyltransferase